MTTAIEIFGSTGSGEKGVGRCGSGRFMTNGIGIPWAEKTLMALLRTSESLWPMRSYVEKYRENKH